jgi:uncharacterized protein (UPF0261 family)
MDEADEAGGVRPVAQPSRPLKVLLIATLDTKASDISYLATLIVDEGAALVVMDVSTRVGIPEIDQGIEIVARDEVAAASGHSLEEIAAMPRGEAIGVMRAGVARLTVAMAMDSQIHGVACIGGAGAHLSGPAFQDLPVGFPKLVVSPLASGDRTFEPYVGLRDVAVLHSVADIAGVNALTSRVYRTAAGYIVGAARSARKAPHDEQWPPTIAVSMNGNTTPAVARAIQELEQLELSCVSFHANGVGGRAMEDFIASGQAVAALDYTTTELGARLVGGLMDPGPKRMEAAARAGIPQVLVPGCVDFITAGRWAPTAEEFPGRLLFAHNPELTLVRLDREEMSSLGQMFAAKANLAVGPTVICVPLRGFSVPDAEGGVFWDPDADAAFVASLQREVADRVTVELVDAHINDPEFVDVAVGRLLMLLGNATRSSLGPRSVDPEPAYADSWEVGLSRPIARAKPRAEGDGDADGGSPRIHHPHEAST